MDRKIQSWMMWAAAGALMLVISWRDVTRMSPRDGLRDYGSFWASGRAATQHQDPYAVYPLTWHFPIPPHGEMRFDPNLNPPLLLPLFEAYARFDPLHGFKVWMIFSNLVVLVGSGFLVWIHRGVLQKRQIVWMLLAPGMLDAIRVGQVYILLFGLSIFIWYLQRSGRDGAAAVGIGLMAAMKPNLLLWPALMLLAGHRRQGAIASLVATGLSLLPVVLYGPQVYLQWLRAFSITDHSIFPNDVSAAGYFGRLGYRPVGYMIALALLLYLAWTVWRRRPSLLSLGGLTIAASILCSPLAWIYYPIFLVPWLVTQAWKEEETLAALLTMVPLVVSFSTIGQSRLIVAMAGAPYFGAIVLFVAIFYKRIRPGEPATVPEQALTPSYTA